MESVIKWHTGEPKVPGCYILTLKDGTVFCDDIYRYITCNREIETQWGIIDSSQIIAWCPLSEIEPYKE